MLIVEGSAASVGSFLLATKTGRPQSHNIIDDVAISLRQFLHLTRRPCKFVYFHFLSASTKITAVFFHP